MTNTIPNLSIAAMAIAALGGIAIPLGLYLYLRKKKGADRLPFWVGCIVFPVFALALEQFAYLGLAKWSGWTALQSNIWLFGPVAGLMAGLFEETGRYTAFQTVLRKKRGKDVNALMYGAGHGGIEAVLLVSVSMISNIVASVTINNGTASALTISAASQLASYPAWMFLVSLVERVAAVTLHISLSVLVWFAAKNAKRFWLFPLAILLHALVDAAAVVLSKYVSNVWLIEGAVYLLTAGCVALAMLVWKRNAQSGEPAALEKMEEAVPEA